MNLFSFQKTISNYFFFWIKILKDLRFAIFLLFLIGLVSSLGSLIEQDQDQSFYQNKYYGSKALYGILDTKIILLFQFDHLYQTWYFQFLLILLALSLTLCSFYNQWPLIKNSKKFFFNPKFKNLNHKKDFLKKQKLFFEKENFLLKSQKFQFYLYQKKDFLYGYKALVGRISPIFVHISLILLLISTSLSAFQHFKAEEILAKGEISHLQNILSLGKTTVLPKLNLRVNDFWISYQNKKVKQFYSNLSLINNYGKEYKIKTISVNQPLNNQALNFYQSDWDIKGIRLIEAGKNTLIEYPVFLLSKGEKIWISWLPLDKLSNEENQCILIFDQLRNTFSIYDQKGKFLREEEFNNFVFQNFRILELIKRTGLLIKYDPTIPLIYLSFGILIASTFLSFLPYQRLCLFTYKKDKLFVSFSSNRNSLNQKLLKFFILSNFSKI